MVQLHPQTGEEIRWDASGPKAVGISPSTFSKKKILNYIQQINFQSEFHRGFYHPITIGESNSSLWEFPPKQCESLDEFWCDLRS